MTRHSSSFQKYIIATTLRVFLSLLMLRVCEVTASNTDIYLNTTALDPLTTGFMMTGGVTGDYFGRWVSKAGDIDNDGYNDIIVGAPSKSSSQGVAYVIYGGQKSSMTNIDFSTTTLDPSTTGFMVTGNAAYDQLGCSVSRAGDIDNDGYDDIIIGAYGKNSGKGAAYVIYGRSRSLMTNIDLSTTTLDPSTTGLMITENAASDNLGWAVSTAGDIDNDGYDDIIVGASNKYSIQGAAYVIYGAQKSSMTNIDLSTTTLDPATTGFTMTGSATGDYFGLSVNTAGDINQDGYDDIIVGAQGKNNRKGAAYVIYGKSKSSMPNINFGTTTLDPLTTGFTITGKASTEYLGWSVSTAGDINNDGYSDIIVSVNGMNSFQGAAYVIYGGANSQMSNFDSSTQILDPLTTGFIMTGNTINDCFGYSVSTAGDINNDGSDDLIVGAFKRNSYQGAAYVIYGSGTKFYFY